MAAGLGFKTFTTGEVLTAADVNGYLMQGVLVFASAAARDAAITSPQEGQACYLKDTDAVLTYSGSAWVGFDDSNAIQNAIINAKGDLIAGSANDTPAILSAGSNGETLVADSSTSTGLRYQTSVNGNSVINGGMDIWQRGISAAGGYPTYLADRWMNYRSTTGSTFSRQNTSDTTNLPNIQYCQRIKRDTGNTNTSGIYISQSLESEESRKFVGQTVVLSWYARAGANFSAASSNMNFELVYGTGTNQNVIAGFTGQANASSGTKTLTTTWQRFSTTTTINTAATQVAVNLYFTPVGTAGADDYMEITGVQLELGSVPTTFKRAGNTLAGELAACQRYYYAAANGTLQALFNGSNYSATAMYGAFSFPVQMRVAPTLSAASSAGIYEFVRNGGADAFNSLSAYATSTTNVILNNTTEISGTAGHGGFVTTSNIFSGLVAFSAEL